MVVLVADQLCKYWLIGLLAEHGPQRLLPFFDLVMVWNRGVSFGLFGGGAVGPGPLVALSAVIAAGLAVWLWRLEGRLLAAAVGLVIGGAVGNVVDRLTRGAVADFFDFHVSGYHWPAFNVADSAIVVGVGLIVLDAFLGRGEPPATPDPDA